MILLFYFSLAMTMTENLFIGTSGYSYPDWETRFYPKDVKKEDWLSFYASRFRTVEINYTYYRLPRVQSVKRWSSSVGKDFVFSAKASRTITHFKRLKDAKGSLDRFLEMIRHLGVHAGPVLFQLPSSMGCDLDVLEDFLMSLPPARPFAFEFRSASWFHEGLYRLMEKHRCAIVASFGASLPACEVLTADFVYIRMHGPQDLYSSSYPDSMLEDLAIKIRPFLKRGLSAFVYFNNDLHAYAVRNALRLMDFLEG